MINSQHKTESAPGKIILFGEHAVVYGIPAIAVPLSDLRATVSWSESSSGKLEIIAKDLKNKNISLEADLSDSNNPLSRIVLDVTKYYKTEPPPTQIIVQSDIPIASGLGSGAAVSAALGRAIARILGHTITDETLNDIVFEVEKIHHGTPSGIDNTVIVYQKAIKFEKNKPIETLKIDTPFSLLIADTGIPALTHQSVSDVRALYENDKQKIQDIFDKIHQIVLSAIDCIANGSIVELGKLMTENHKLLRELTVSSLELDSLVEVAINAGALGAKLSGGGRGGNMISLVESEKIDEISQQLLSAGANRVFSTIVK